MLIKKLSSGIRKPGKRIPRIIFFELFSGGYYEKGKAFLLIKNIAALTIAGSDSGGGAGIQADLKTFSALGVYGTTVITAVTAQNLREVNAIQPVDPGIVEKQLLAVLDGFPVKAIKTGMLFSEEIIKSVSRILRRYPDLPLVIDPVITATSGSELLRKEAVKTLKTQLFPQGTLITPNIAEAKILVDINFLIENRNDLERAAKVLFEKFKVPVLLKGGHLSGSACDVFCDPDGTTAYHADMIKGVNNHGSGCTLSAAITAFLARGAGIRAAISGAKAYITGCLKQPLQLDADTRVINHFQNSPF